MNGTSLTKLLAVTAALAATPGSALAQGTRDAARDDAREGVWVLYAEKANGDLHFYDPSRMTKIDRLRHVWEGVQYKTSVMGASSFLHLLEIDCSERTQRILQRTFFTDGHWQKAAMKPDTKAKPKRGIAAGSTTERLAQIVCG